MPKTALAPIPHAVPDHVFTSVSSLTLSELVRHELVKGIVRGDFAESATLPSDKELGRQFSVSRSVVREAVKEVAMLGLISRRQGKATRICEERQWRQLAPEVLLARTETGHTEIGSVDDVLLELLELRRIVEVEAAGLAARRATEHDIALMRDELQSMDDHLRDTDAFTFHDLAFHNAVLMASANHLLPPLFEQLRPLLEFGRRISAKAMPDNVSRSQHGHRAVFEAVVSGDSDLARQSMTDHLNWTAGLDFNERERRLRSSQHLRPGSAQAIERARHPR